MSGDVKSRDTMLAVQGERVLTHWHSQDGTSGEAVLTFVHVVDTDHHQLRLANRDKKSGGPDWPVSQRLFDSIKPAPPNKLEAKWALSARI